MLEKQQEKILDSINYASRIQHSILLPEEELLFEEECRRLNKIMDRYDCVNIFLSEGAGMDTIVREIESQGQEVPRDAFGHVRLDDINPGQWFAKQFAEALYADKTLIQKSGYFARSAKPGVRDLALIKKSAFMAVDFALKGESGLVGLDENNNGELGLIDLQLIEGGKEFDTSQKWFTEMLNDIGQL